MLHRLLGWGPPSSSYHVDLFIGPPITWVIQGGQREDGNRSCYNLILDMIPHCFCHILFIRRRITQGCEWQDVGITGASRRLPAIPYSLWGSTQQPLSHPCWLGEGVGSGLRFGVQVSMSSKRQSVWGQTHLVLERTTVFSNYIPTINVFKVFYLL